MARYMILLIVVLLILSLFGIYALQNSSKYRTELDLKDAVALIDVQKDKLIAELLHDLPRWDSPSPIGESARSDFYSDQEHNWDTEYTPIPLISRYTPDNPPVRIYGDQVDDDLLFRLSKIKTLNVIFFQDASKLTIDGVAAIGTLPDLKALSLPGMSIDSFEIYNALKNCDRLEVLHISNGKQNCPIKYYDKFGRNCAIYDLPAGATYFPLSANLWFDFDSNSKYFNPYQFSHLARIYCQSSKRVDTDMLIEFCKAHPTISEIHLDYSKIDLSVIREIVSYLKNPQFIGLKGTVVDHDTVKLFQTWHPGCRVHWNGNDSEMSELWMASIRIHQENGTGNSGWAFEWPPVRLLGDRRFLR